MKVLNKLPKDADLTKYRFLPTKVVYDWRHRVSEWRRRGRLVAREFRWLGDTDIASLFSPTGVTSTVKLLSALFTSSEGYSLGSIDVGDAYLMVEQEEPTVVEVDGEYYELGILNKLREDKPEKPVSEAGTDPSSSSSGSDDEEEKREGNVKTIKEQEEKRENDEEEEKKEDDEVKEDFKKTAEELKERKEKEQGDVMAQDLAEKKNIAEERRSRIAKEANEEAEKAKEAEEANEEAAEKAKEAEETDEEAAEKATARSDESENPVTPTERQRLKDEFATHVEAIWSTITCDVEDTLMVERGLPSQEMERQYSDS
eukprot:s5691_g5.t1